MAVTWSFASHKVCRTLDYQPRDMQEMKKNPCPHARPHLVSAIALILAAGTAATAAAQMGRNSRSHTTLQSDGQVTLQPADQAPPGTNTYTMEVVGTERIITANGIANHSVGRFPGDGNPNRISAQNYRFVLDATPRKASQPGNARGYPFGIAISGVVFDPGAAEWYRGQPGPWQYEPLSGAVRLGLDANNAHVQPTGAYHYHGLPTALMNELGVSRDTHSPLIGWAADGFPIYAKFGHLDGVTAQSSIIEHTPSYKLKDGPRQATANGRGETPGGYYDGTFVADYEYVEGLGTLDACNGIFTVTPEFPNGTYAYFLTTTWPVIPRCFSGTPSPSFTSLRPNTGRDRPGSERGDRRGPPPGTDRFGRPPPRF